MGKKISFILAGMFILSLAGCGDQGNTEKAAEVAPVVQGDDNRTEGPENGAAQEAEDGNTTESAPNFGTLISITDTEEGETGPSLTADQIEAAKQAALAYYEGTVFSVNAIEYLEGELPYGDVEGGCNFTVNVSKNGVVQEPDRTISLQPVQDGWEVVNEGY